VADPRPVGAVTWDGTRLEVVTLPRPPGGPRTVAAFDYAAPGDARYDVVLRRGGRGGWWLRGPLPDGRLFAHVAEERAKLISLPSDAGVIPLARCRMHAHDVLTAIGEHRLHVMRPVEGWQAITLPEDMRVEDVSFDSAGGLWLAGSAVRYRAPGSDRFERRPPRLGLLAALRILPRGGLERLRTIDADGDWKVATSDSPRLLDDPSSFIFAWRDAGDWTASRLRGRLVRRVLPVDGDIMVVTNDGAVYSIGGGGRLVELSGGAGLRKLLTRGPAEPQPRLTIRDASAGQGILAVVAGLSRVDAGRLSWLATAVCVSEDRGLSWSVLERTEPAAGQPELLTVAA